MASYTTNLNLKKPAGSENVAIGDINGNMDTIDTAYGSLKSLISGSIPNNTNLDSFLNQGIYRSPSTISGVETLTNCPTDVPFTLIVSGDGTIGGSVQTVLTQGHIYTRRGSSGSWGNWYDFVGSVVS